MSDDAPVRETTDGPIWGSPGATPRPSDSGVQDPPRYPPPPPPPPPAAQNVRWGGQTRPDLDPATIQRQATVALVVNLLVLFFALGLCSAPGAILAVRAQNLARVDAARAKRSLMWSWILLASNLLLYVLAILVIVFLAISIFSSIT